MNLHHGLLKASKIETVCSDIHRWIRRSDGTDLCLVCMATK